MAKKGQIPWNKGKKNLQIAWNKGLTKEINESVKKISEGLKGRYYSDETREKLRKAYFKNIKEKGHPSCGKKRPDASARMKKFHEKHNTSGRNNPFYGKKHSEKTKSKIGLKSKKRWGDSTYRGREIKKIRERWQNKEYREKTIRTLVKSNHIRPTSFEKKIMNLCKKYNLPFKYVGNGGMFIDGLNPDFIETNGKKIVIETYYSYWKIKNYSNTKEYEKERKKRLNKYGYEIIFLNEKDLERKDWEIFCLDKIIGGI